MGDAARNVLGLLTRKQAAEMLTLSLRQFERICKTIPHVKVGARGVRYLERDLIVWVEQQKGLGRSTRKRAPTTSASTSPTPENDTVSPQARRILERLRSKQRASTPRLFQVASDE